MRFRDLTIRVLGGFSNEDYAHLAYRVGHCLQDAGLQDRAIFVTDGKITGPEMDAPYGVEGPAVPRRN